MLTAKIWDAIYIGRFVKRLIVNGTDCTGTKFSWNELQKNEM